MGGSIPSWQWQMVAAGAVLTALMAYRVSTRGAADQGAEQPRPEPWPTALVAAVAGPDVWVVPPLGGVPVLAHEVAADEELIGAAVDADAAELYVHVVDAAGTRVMAHSLRGGPARELAHWAKRVDAVDLSAFGQLGADVGRALGR